MAVQTVAPQTVAPPPPPQTVAPPPAGGVITQEAETSWGAWEATEQPMTKIDRPGVIPVDLEPDNDAPDLCS
jgi:hypothetical protein